MFSEVAIQNLLTEHADALLNGAADIDNLLKTHGIQKDTRTARLMILAERLNAALQPVEPSPQFVNNLYGELVGTSRFTVRDWWRYLQFDRPLSRLRHLPLYMQLVAGLTSLTVTAGVIFVASRFRRETTALVTETDEPTQKSA